MIGSIISGVINGLASTGKTSGQSVGDYGKSASFTPTSGATQTPDKQSAPTVEQKPIEQKPMEQSKKEESEGSGSGIMGM